MDFSHIIQTGLSNSQLISLISAIISGFISIVLFSRKRIRLSIFFLFLCGLILRLLASTLDPFLNTWDEQYHALVAKNMMIHPFKPMLYSNPVLDYDYRMWISNHIWLHKQPWFLWQICIFFKLFGVNEFALRLPTVLMFSFMILIIYRIGELLTNRETGWYAAFLYTFSFFYVNYTSGSTFSDHNDSAFIFYIALSLWAWIKYIQSPKRKWIILLAIFTGIAILNKWLAGLVIYSAWFVSFLLTKGGHEKLKEILNMGLSLVILLFIVVPWQIYILTSFPRESHHEFQMASRHIFEAVEKHHETVFYYLLQLPVQYGGIIVYFIILPGLFLFFRQIKETRIRYGLLFTVIFVYLFFSMAATRMPMYCSIVMPLIFLGLGSFTNWILRFPGKILPEKWYTVFLAVILSSTAFLSLNTKQMDSWHSVKSKEWNRLRQAALIDQYAGTQIHDRNSVVFNCGSNNSIMYMFYNNSTAYGSYPTLNEYHDLKSRDIKIAVFADNNLPDFLKNDPAVQKIYLRNFQY